MAHQLDIPKLLQDLTLEEKAGLCSGLDFWHTKAVDRLGIPSVMVSDGPHGLRKQDMHPDHLGMGESVEAICFPTASAMACSFDRDLLYSVGDALGEECVAEDLAVLLGPGINMKRSPICGRNFEYYSEDPLLAGELAASFVNGVQSHGVGTSLKHFAVNNQENRRMSVSAEVDERTLREIYLSAFETVIKKAQPWTVMCSYNRINGVYSSDNPWLLQDVLRDEWGFQGLVMTDWGAMNDRVTALKAGLDLEMPSSHGETDKQIVAAVQDGSLSEEVLDRAVTRVLSLVNQYLIHKQDTTYDKETHHNLARKTAEQSAVLLKNNGILPLQNGQKVAIIGEFAQTARIQGGGSSHINCYRVESALDAIAQNAITGTTYAQGFRTDVDETDPKLLQEAIQAARDAEVAVIFAGLPDAFESEGFDRKHLNMPSCQNELIQKVCEVQPNTVVVLHSGSPVVMPWLNQVNAVLNMYLSGQASGGAAVNLLYGKSNPSGKLAETFPLRLEDNPSYLNFPGTRYQVNYQEGIFIGYRYYDKKNMDVLFPFGYGLSYTSFTYDNLQLSKQEATDADTITVSVDVRNVGQRAGAEIVQLYVHNPDGEEIRPEKELRNFVKVFLEPGESKTVTMELNGRAFSYYHTEIHDWYAEDGEYEILIGASSRDIRLKQSIRITSTKQIPFVAGDTTTWADVKLFAKDPSVLDHIQEVSGFTNENRINDDSLGAGADEMMANMFADTPLHSILSFSGKELKYEDIQDAIRKINEQK
ncbi:MAG: glycoside hydrolase family 3 C-terminal domain-containing protein [Lachnospiraceae bacterium]|nr:glycoside hydrolase family 3 C-terminal domain-containing protein [Lachnospiraceae bacterium]